VNLYIPHGSDETSYSWRKPYR